MPNATAPLVVLSLFLCCSCGSGSNACVGVGGVWDVCYQDENDSSSCNAFNQQGLNGDTWTFYDGQTCADRGFSHSCPNGNWLPPTEQCAT